MSAPAVATRHVEHVMGMPISLALRGRHADTRAGRDAWAAALASLREADRVFSPYRADSWVSKLDRGEVGLAECPTEVADVLALGRAATEQSGGAFSVYRPDAGGRLRFDPSGVVKGWAVQRAAAPLQALPDTDFSLGAGGDLLCRTADPDAPAWRIGIEHPHQPSRLIAVVPVRDGAVATSGTAHRGSHLLDARTGRPPLGVAQVTVIGPTLTWADLDATAAYAQGRDAARWLARRPGRTGLVVWPDATTTVVPAA
jgi:thiamine biosynthesis lipoprotein